METAGDICGIVQLSAEICRMTIVSEEGSETKDKATMVEREVDVFNKYVDPQKDAQYWDEFCIGVHNIRPTDKRIKDADFIGIVWDQFHEWVNKHIPDGNCGILVAWNGAQSDMKWLWRLTQAPNTPYKMPAKLKYFIDPYRVVSGYNSCKINQRHSHIDGYSLGVVWTYLNEEKRNLNGQHDSLVDARAQTDIIVNQYFVPFIDRTQSVQTIHDIFTRTQQNEWKKKLEPLRGVHWPWEEITNMKEEDNKSWINYAIGMEWNGTSNNKPDWMRQTTTPLPCGCKRCYFCINKITNGIEHKNAPVVSYACGSQLNSEGRCTTERVTLPKSRAGYCRLCYKSQPESSSRSGKRKASNYSTKGCLSCNDPICKTCWVKYDHGPSKPLF